MNNLRIVNGNNYCKVIEVDFESKSIIGYVEIVTTFRGAIDEVEITVRNAHNQVLGEFFTVIDNVA